MRITSRIAAGLLVIVGFFAGVLLHQLSSVEQLQRINRELALTNLEAARVSIRLLQGLEGVREFAHKSWALGDADYARQWEFWEEAVDEDFQALARMELSGPENELRTRMEEGWREYHQAAQALREDPGLPVDEVDWAILDVQEDVRTFVAVNDSAVASRGEASAAAGDRARTVAWLAAGTGLLIAALFSFLLFRSISGPLRNLTRGTREVAHGRFDHRLEVEGPAELSGLARDFNRMAARLDELEDLKRDFVSHVSHELKTPLAAVQETVEILLEEIPGPLEPSQVRLLEKARKSSQRLSGMIGDLLEVSRLEAGAGGFHPESCDLEEIVSGVLDEVEPLASDQHLQVQLQAPTAEWRLVCDGERIREVVANLVGNAVKFSPPDQRIRVSLSHLQELPSELPPGSESRVGRESEPFLQLSVEDRGPGVPDDEKDQIFEKFHQAGRTGQRRGTGVGLGLAIARRIVEAHRGAIWVDDGPEGGAVFQVILPKVPSQWSDLPPEDIPEGRRDVATPEPRPALSGIRAAGKASTMALGALLLGGCASLPVLGGSEPEPEPAPKPDTQAEAPRPMESSPEPPTPEESAVQRGRTLMEAGDMAAARVAYLEALEWETDPRERAEAFWTLGILHLLPDGPDYDPEAAIEFLEAAAEHFPETLAGIQAAWARDMISELEEVQARALEQERLLGELRETLERLRQIDLERTPSGRPAPPDTLDPSGSAIDPPRF